MNGVLASAFTVAAWYALAGATDTVVAECIQTTGLVALPVFGTFAVAAGCGVLVDKGAVGELRRGRVAQAGASVCVGFGAMQVVVWLRDLRLAYALKTAEPLATVILSLAVGDSVSLSQCAAVAVVCCGAAMLSAGSGGVMQGSATAAFLALVSNTALSLRTVLSRPLLSNGVVPPARLFAALSIGGACTSLPFALLEAGIMSPGLAHLRTAALAATFSGVSYFGYNLIGFVVLRKVPSASYAVIKEMRCMVVYIWTLLWVRRPLANSSLCGEGFLVTLLGVLCYAAACAAPEQKVGPWQQRVAV
eukprot:Hpha_TRINITY_DN35477_c0_g1::TRINITY_DN35477_c0_g1_i1::g.83396::m.83396/K15283/SLC35E1; solute carrier family 35, member E1